MNLSGASANTANAAARTEVVARLPRARLPQVTAGAQATQQAVGNTVAQGIQAHDDLGSAQVGGVKRDTLWREVIGADDRRVPPGIAAPEPALFEDGDIPDAVVLAKVVGRRKAMPARADDDDVVAGSCRFAYGWLLEAGCWKLVAGNWLLEAGRWLLAIRNS